MEANVIPNHSDQKHPSSFRAVFLLLLLGALAAAAASAYVLVTNKATQPLPAPPLTVNENPFESKPVPANPFFNAENEVETVNPFVSTGEDNPFSQFDYESDAEVQTTDEYQNPF